MSAILLVLIEAGNVLPAFGQSCSPSTNKWEVGDWDDLMGPFFYTKRCNGGADNGKDCTWGAACPGGACVEPTVASPFPMHAILLKTGKVLILPTGGRGGRPGDIYNPELFKVMLFDPADAEIGEGWGEADFRKREFPVPQGDFPHLVPCSGHAALPDGRLLFVGGEGYHPVAARATIFDPTLVSVDSGTGQVTCNNCWITQADMPDVPNPRSICPGTPLMSARYYPTVTAMGDGRMLIMGGASEGRGCQLVDAEGANTPMIFDYTKPLNQQWTLLTGGEGLPGPGLDSVTPDYDCSGCTSWDTTNECYCSNGTTLAAQYPAHWANGGNPGAPNKFHVPYYAHNFLLSDGSVYMAGSLAGPYANIKFPCTPASDDNNCMDPWEVGPVHGKFSTSGLGSWNSLTPIFGPSAPGLATKIGATVMYAPNKLLKAGGIDSTTATKKIARSIDLSATTGWQDVTDMNFQRRGVNLVMLPDGKVLAATGASGPTTNINCPEIWTPGGGWAVMSSMDAPSCMEPAGNCDPDDLAKGNIHVRADHSEAILLPDARVLVLGGEYHAGNTPGNKSAQIFSPPYLFIPDVPRPVIALIDPGNGPGDTIQYGVPTKLIVSGDVDAVSLIKLGATTHGFDQDQRFIPLDFQPVSAPPTPYNWEIYPPANGYDAPPGYYMLFVLNDGVPSVARIVKLESCVPAGTSPDCNNNGLPDACDISAQTSTDCDSNGIPDECPCPSCPCPVGLISSTAAASPPNLTRDARQPHPLNDNSLAARQGIGSAAEPISITLTTCGNIKPTCFQLCETGREMLESGQLLSPNQIMSVAQSESNPNTYNLVLARPISAGYWTSIKYWWGGTKVSYASLPADVNVNNVSNAADVTYLNGCLSTPSLCGTSYRRDIDRLGIFDGADETRVGELLSGAGTFLEWQGWPLYSNTCFQGGGGPYCPSAPCGGGGGIESMSMMQGGGEESFGEQSLLEGSEQLEPYLDENAHMANGFASLLTESDPVGVEELALFHTYVSEMTGWCLVHFSAAELAPFVQWLGDPERTFASQAGQNAAAEVVAALTP